MNKYQKIIVITGTRKGIGLELTKHFLEQGHIVIGCSRRKSEFTHKSYEHYIVDVSDEKSVVKMIRSIKKIHGSIDVLLNNAGIAAMNALLLTPLSTFKKVFDTNVQGTFLFLRETAKTMIKQRRGRIINYSTVAAALDLEGEAIYAASKAAVESLTRVASKELGQYGITVNAIGPTPIETDLIKLVPKNKIDELIEKQAIRRLGLYEDVTNVIDFLIAEESDFITGQTIYLGGVN